MQHDFGRIWDENAESELDIFTLKHRKGIMYPLPYEAEKCQVCGA